MPFIDAPALSTHEVALFGEGDLYVCTGDQDGVTNTLLIYAAEGPGAIGPSSEVGRQEEAERICPIGVSTEGKPARIAMRFERQESVQVVISQLEAIRNSLDKRTIAART